LVAKSRPRAAAAREQTQVAGVELDQPSRPVLVTAILIDAPADINSLRQQAG
jgi:hypothetical protein